MTHRSLHVVLLALSIALLPLQPLGAQSTPRGLTVQDADIRVFIEDVARATGITFIVDPRVQGSVTVSREAAMSEQELLGVLLSVLRGNGLIAIPAGTGMYRVVPDDTAAQQPSSLGFTTHVFPLRSIDARIAAETLKPLVGRGGVVMATPQGNSLLVADYADNIRRIRSLVAQIDSDRAGIDTVTLRNSSANEIANTINQLFRTGGEGGQGAVLSVLPVESSNSIVVRGDPSLIQRVVQTILELDRRAERTGDVRVIKLQHANAEQLLPVLQQLVGQAPASQGDAATEDVAAVQPGMADPGLQVLSATPGKRPTIVRYPGSNALIINADPETQRLLADVITQLDTRREQVLVEAIVVEISDNAARELGVQLLVAGREGSNVPFAATQYPGSSPGIMSLAGAAAAQRRGDTEGNDSALDLARNVAMQSLLGLNGALAGLAGSNDNALFGLIINAVKSDTGSNLLSTPSVLTLDNEEARILVGQEVPITTGEVLGDANTNPFRTTARQDIGILLEVKPQINAGGGITLFLRQEVSSIAGAVNADSDLILNKRELETKVLVDDGAIVALGGLLDRNDRNTIDKIPGLGDLPLVGGLFRNTSRRRDQTNLMVFIRPTIVRTAAQAERMSAGRYEYVRDRQPQLPGTQEAALETLVRDYLRTTPPTWPTHDALPIPAPVPAPVPAPAPAPATDPGR